MTRPAPAAALARLRADFTYRADGRLDVWTVPTARGAVRGDCEDFALALAFRLAGRSWWRLAVDLATHRTVIWHCLSRGAGRGHAVLWHRGAGWADNICPTWRAETPHERVFPWVAPLAAWKLAISPVFAWVNRTVKRAKHNGDA